jgi:hypothetical protein
LVEVAEEEFDEGGEVGEVVLPGAAVAAAGGEVGVGPGDADGGDGEGAEGGLEAGLEVAA